MNPLQDEANTVFNAHHNTGLKHYDV